MATTSRKRRLWRACCCVVVSGILFGACSPCNPDPSLYPAPRKGFIGRRCQEPLRAEQADVALIFIGGFFEQGLVHMRTLYERMPPLDVPGKQFRAFYAWDGGRGNLLFHHTGRIRRDLQAFLNVNPEAMIVMIGHSYGGSAAMDVVRGLNVSHGPVAIVTIDPVSRRARSHPRERAKGVDYWLNVYCTPYATVRDIVPHVGGAWRHCPQADENIVFDGRRRDCRKRRYQHSYPMPMMLEKDNSRGESPRDLLNEALHKPPFRHS